MDTAKRLLASPNWQLGLFRLWELDAVEISVEAAVLDAKFQSLFTVEERAEAESRLSRLRGKGKVA